jgi:hypothetical protein
MNTNKMVEEWQRFKNFVGDIDISNIVKFAITDRVEKLLSLQKIHTLEEVEEKIREYFDGLIAIPYPPATLESLLAKLTSLKQDSGEIKK